MADLTGVRAAGARGDAALLPARRAMARAGATAVWNMVRAGGPLGVVGLGTGVLNFAFYVEVARASGPARYGAVAALLILPTVAMFLAAGTAYTAGRIAALHRGRSRDMLSCAFSAVWPWLIVTLALLAVSGITAGYLGLSSWVPVALAILTFGAVMVNSVATGILASHRRHVAVTCIQLGSAVSRLGLGVVLTRGSDPITGAVLCCLVPVVISGAMQFALAARPVRRDMQRAMPEADRIKTPAGEGASSAFLAACLWTLWALPLFIARHSLESDVAGAFAAAQLLASGLVWTIAIWVKALYPNVVRRPSARVLSAGFSLTLAVCALGSAVLVIAGARLLDLVFGPGFVLDVGVFGALCCAASGYAIAIFLLWISRAVKRYVFLVSLWIILAVPAEAVVGSVLRASPFQLAIGPVLALVAGWLAATLVSWGAARRLPRPIERALDAVSPVRAEAEKST